MQQFHWKKIMGGSIYYMQYSLQICCKFSSLMNNIRKSAQNTLDRPVILCNTNFSSLHTCRPQVQGHCEAI